MAYNPFNPNKPAGADTPPVYSADDLNNIRALRDAVVCGFMPGWSFAASAPVSQDLPASYTWASGVLRFRVLLTYGTPAWVITTALWQYSENSGGAYVAITTGGTPVAITSDLAGGTYRITGVDKDAGLWVFAFMAVQRALAAQVYGDGHAAATGTAVHGLGTMSTQNANAVVISGGIVQTVNARKLVRLSPYDTQLLATGAVWDWAAVPTMSRMAAGGTIANIIGADDGEMKRILVVGSGAITITFANLVWGVGMPLWGTNATIVNFVYVAATGKIYATTIPF